MNEYDSYAATTQSAQVSPRQIGMRGWLSVARRVKDEIGDDNVVIIAAGMAFFGLLALFPALAALVSIYGMVADPVDVQRHSEALASMLPPSVRSVVHNRLEDLIAHSASALKYSAVASIAAALWSASAGTKSSITAINIAYDESEKRGFLKLRGLALLLTLGAVLVVSVSLILLTVLPTLLSWLPFTQLTKAIVSYGRWPLLVVLMMLALAVLYRYAPCRKKPRWRWVSSGAVLATLLWLLATLGFSFYVSHFGSYAETYGAVGGVVVLMLWLFITSFVVLLGAEVNAEVEKQKLDYQHRLSDL